MTFPDDFIWLELVPGRGLRAPQNRHLVLLLLF